jgi:hypothetical protein
MCVRRWSELLLIRVICGFRVFFVGVRNRSWRTSSLFYLESSLYYKFIQAIANKKNNEIEDLSEDSSATGKVKYFLFQNL